MSAKKTEHGENEQNNFQIETNSTKLREKNETQKERKKR